MINSLCFLRNDVFHSVLVECLIKLHVRQFTFQCGSLFKKMNGELNFVQAVKVLLRKITLLVPNFVDL